MRILHSETYYEETYVVYPSRQEKLTYARNSQTQPPELAVRSNEYDRTGGHVLIIISEAIPKFRAEFRVLCGNDFNRAIYPSTKTNL